MKKLLLILLCIFITSGAKAQELKLNDIKNPLSQRSYIFNYFGSQNGIRNYQAIKTINTIILQSDSKNRLIDLNFSFFNDAHQKDLSPVLRDLQITFMTIAADQQIAQNWLNECLQRKQKQIKTKDNRFFYKCNISEDVSEFIAQQR